MISEPAPFTLRRGTSPLIVSMPHVGTFLPPPLAERLTDVAHRLPDTDWHVDRLYAFLDRLDITVLKPTSSRYVIDLNRPPDGVLLYPGRAETGLCPTESFAGEPLYRDGAAPDTAEIATRLATYWRPYHQALETEIARVKGQRGRALLFDAHSIKSRLPRLFDGRLPDLNFGSADGRSASAALLDRLVAATEGSNFSRVVNGRFKGGYITRHYGVPETGVEAVQLELGWAAYLDEARPDQWDEARATPLMRVIERVIDAALLHAS